jgi:mono/diheme cytochrome c family protein
MALRLSSLLLLAGLLICPFTAVVNTAPPTGASGSGAVTTPAWGQDAAAATGAQVSQGRALFLQRCALCHLSPDGWRKSGLAPSIGPSLSGVMKDGSPERENAVREKIRRGSAVMPGFEYGLDAQQLDRVIAYLKTLR